MKNDSAYLVYPSQNLYALNPVISIRICQYKIDCNHWVYQKCFYEHQRTIKICLELNHLLLRGDFTSLYSPKSCRNLGIFQAAIHALLPHKASKWVQISHIFRMPQLINPFIKSSQLYMDIQPERVNYLLSILSFKAI